MLFAKRMERKLDTVLSVLEQASGHLERIERKVDAVFARAGDELKHLKKKNEVLEGEKKEALALAEELEREKNSLLEVARVLDSENSELKSQKHIPAKDQDALTTSALVGEWKNGKGAEAWS